MSLSSLFKTIKYTPPTQEEAEGAIIRVLKEFPNGVTTSYMEFKMMFFLNTADVRKVLTQMLIRRLVDFKNDLWYSEAS